MMKTNYSLIMISSPSRHIGSSGRNVGMSRSEGCEGCVTVRPGCPWPHLLGPPLSLRIAEAGSSLGAETERLQAAENVICIFAFSGCRGCGWILKPRTVIFRATQLALGWNFCWDLIRVPTGRLAEKTGLPWCLTAGF